MTTGCATTPEPNPWDLQVGTTPATQPFRLPNKCIPSEVTDNAAIFNVQGIQCLQGYYEIAEANTVIAGAHADQVDRLKDSVTALNEAGAAQRRVADIRKQILEEERKHHFFEKLGLWGLVALSISAGGVL